MSTTAPPLLTPGYLFNADPTCRQIGERFFVFCTHDQTSVQFQGPEDHWHNMVDYHALSTRDFIQWVDHGTILNSQDVTWARDFSVWDGDAGIVGPDGRYWAYVPFRDDTFKIAAMVADRPEGPYRDALGRPFITNDWLREQGFTLDEKYTCTSPTVTRGDDGRLYLLFGQFQVFLAPLTEDMTSFCGPVIELDIPKRGGAATEYVEGPMLHKIGNKWYFSYMTYKDWDGRNDNFVGADPLGPYIQYCVGDQMTGPFSRPRHWIYPVAPDACNIQHGLGQFNGEWFVAYHLPFEGKQHRQTTVTRLNLGTDGSLLPIFPSEDRGVTNGKPTRLLLDAFAAKREAEEFHARFDAIEERGVKQDFHLKLKAGGWLCFKNVDFGETGASQFRAAVSCENCRIKGAFLEVRLDRPDGPLIATLPVQFTYWIVYYASATAACERVPGIHDVYLVARGSGGDASGRLFNVNWFKFDR